MLWIHYRGIIMDGSAEGKQFYSTREDPELVQEGGFHIQLGTHMVRSPYTHVNNLVWVASLARFAAAKLNLSVLYPSLICPPLALLFHSRERSLGVSSTVSRECASARSGS